MFYMYPYAAGNITMVRGTWYLLVDHVIKVTINNNTYFVNLIYFFLLCVGSEFQGAAVN